MTTPASQFSRSALVLCIGLGVSFCVTAVLDGLILCASIQEILLGVLALLAVRLPWRRLLIITGRDIWVGTGTAVLLYGATVLTYRMMTSLWPGVEPQAVELYRELDGLPLWTLPVVVLVIVSEEVVWRAAIAYPVAARFGSIAGILASATAFTLVHVAFGAPLLLVAAFGAGLCWAALAVTTGHIGSALVCHVIWDGLLFFVFEP